MRIFLSVLALLAVSACTGEAGPERSEPVEPSASIIGAPGLEVETVADDLELPWDLAFLPDGEMLFTQRDRKTVTLRTQAGDETTVLDAPDGMWSGGETGLMGIEPASDFETSGDFFTCHGYRSGGTEDVRVVRWHLEGDEATEVDTIVDGLPTSTGRHGGCALAVGPDDALYVGTGDAATGANPQDLESGGGKVLRVDQSSGAGLDDNPFADASDEMQRRVWTYGHRNIQGLAFDDAGDLWSVEHGPDRDDEVNRSVKGGNYGWNPVPGYNESVPMTDQDLPGEQVDAAWRSGDSTIAVSGGAFLEGDAWGDYEGALAVSALKDQSIRIMLTGDDGTVTDVVNPAELDGEFGRLRAAVAGNDGALYVTTSEGGGDKILRITPAR